VSTFAARNKSVWVLTITAAAAQFFARVTPIGVVNYWLRTSDARRLTKGIMVLALRAGVSLRSAPCACALRRTQAAK
jgi:hypothetical protein